jgi:hypothetical protein
LGVRQKSATKDLFSSGNWQCHSAASFSRASAGAKPPDKGFVTIKPTRQQIACLQPVLKADIGLDPTDKLMLLLRDNAIAANGAGTDS